MTGSDILAALPASSRGYAPAGDDVVKLNQNESPYTLTPQEWASLQAEIRAVPLNRYPDPGHRAVEDLIADMCGLPADMVLAGNGANELLELLVRSTCNPGDEALTAAPTYHLYDRFCAVNRARLVKIGWGPDLALPWRELLGSVTGRTRLVLLCRPNNPTGHLYPAADVLAVAEAFPGLVAVDEAYYDFSADTLAGSIGAAPNVAVVRTLSKAYGAAGVRFGYLLASPEIVRAVRSLQMPYGMGALTQAAALFLLGHPGIMERQRDAILAGRQDLATRLERVSGVTVLASSANFVLVRTEGSADALDGHLRSRGILVRNANWQDRFLRISVGTPEEHARLATAIRAFGSGGASA